jgi:hypothetical protein
MPIDQTLWLKDPDPDQRINDAWVLVAIMPDGAEGVFSRTVGKYILNFVATEARTKDQLEDFLRDNGVIRDCRRMEITLEWRKMVATPTRVQIT